MPTLTQVIHQAAERAMTAGVLLPLRSDTVHVREAELDFEVSCLSSVSLKELARITQQSNGANPFLPYDPQLFVADLSASHVLLLNKFPMDPRHVMAVTREFVPQDAPLGAADFDAVAQLMAAEDALFMLNGGKAAGASQPHRHVHVIPGRRVPLAAGFPAACARQPFLPISAFRFVHAFARVDPAQAHARGLAGHLQELFEGACRHCGLAPRDGVMPPYNLLATREWLLLVPRTREQALAGTTSVWISALNFGGLFSVRDPQQIPVVQEAGLLALLEAVTVPVA